jgi:hypothetical protein
MLSPNSASLAYPWHLPLIWHSEVADSKVPASFDWRKQNGVTLTPVQDQGGCGSCWAFSATQSLADRLRIANKSNTIPVLSAEYVKDCGRKTLADQYNRLLHLKSTQQSIGSCNEGGLASMGCEFLEMYGVPSAEQVPYSQTTYSGQDVMECQQIDSKKTTLYTALSGSTSLVTLGVNGSQPASHIEQITGTLDSKTIAANCLNMQKNIMLYGPLCASIMAYKDLVLATFNGNVTYEDGIYTPNPASGSDGGHAITIVGWGVGAQTKTPYWIVRNSWGPTWNGDGYFLIVRGSNASSIESCAVSLQAGSVGGGVGPISGSVIVSSISALTDGWSTSKKLGLGLGLGAAGICLIALIVALAIYTRDKGFKWTQRTQ